MRRWQTWAMALALPALALFALDRSFPLPLPQGVSDSAVGVTSGAEPDIVWLFAIVVAALASVGAMRLRQRRHVEAGLWTR